MRRLAAPAILLLVTGLFLAYGRFSWSWLAGPVAALAVGAIDRKAREPARRQPAPVD